MLIPVILFAIGLVALIKGGDWFVDGATGIAHRFHIPEILIGATVVSIGTTLPEVMVSATDALGGEGSIAYGNAIGSIICNTALIAALTVAIRPSKVDRKPLYIPVIFFTVAAIFYAITAYTSGKFSLLTGIILLAMFVIYMTLTVWQAFKSPEKNVEPAELLEALGENVPDEKQESDGGFVGFLIVGVCLLAAQLIPFFTAPETLTGFGDWLAGILGVLILAIGVIKWAVKKRIVALNSNILFLVLGAGVIAIGATLLVDNGTIIATELGVPETVIALTFVALGTSLPELVTAITSLAKGHGALSLGNVIGANLFNLVLVSGVSVTLSPFDVPVDKTVAGMNASLVVDIPLVFLTMGLLIVPTLIRGKLSRVQGILLLGIYATFCVFQFVA